MDTEVVIIGGGPCGLLSSLLLARSGVRNIVLEKHPDISFHPKAMGTTRRTAEIFRQLGLLEAILEKDIRSSIGFIQVWMRSFVGEEFGRSPVAEFDRSYSPCSPFSCPQPHIEAVLKDTLAHEELAEVRFNSRVFDTVESGDGVVVTFEDRNTGIAERVQGSWIVAADGAASPVRERLGIETKGPGDRGNFLNVYFRADYSPKIQGRESLLYSLLDDEYYELIVTVNGKDEWLMHHFLQPGESAEDYSPEKFVEIIQEVSGLPEVPVEVMSISPWAMSPKVASEWRAGRVLFTGDAAARLSPAGGLGMNTGLQSAVNLAWKLAAVVHGQASPDLLDTYVRERMEVVQFIFANAEGNADEVFEIIGLAMSGDWERAKSKIQHSRRAGSGAGLDLGLTYGCGAFVADGTGVPVLEDPVNDYTPTARPGHLAPHIAIQGPNGESSIIDMLGQNFVLVTGPDGGSWESAAEDLKTTYFKGVRLRAESIGKSIDVNTNKMLGLYGIESDGAVLVRPDGYVAARWQTSEGHDKDSLETAIRTVFAL
tara:strand:+ start:6068 stop:7690 length:1623 start_codon:yes stop_codon:yes gene_type:complete